jgi:hypothetical protein
MEVCDSTWRRLSFLYAWCVVLRTDGKVSLTAGFSLTEIASVAICLRGRRADVVEQPQGSDWSRRQSPRSLAARNAIHSRSHALSPCRLGEAEADRNLPQPRVDGSEVSAISSCLPCDALSAPPTSTCSPADAVLAVADAIVRGCSS